MKSLPRNARGWGKIGYTNRVVGHDASETLRMTFGKFTRNLEQ